MGLSENIKHIETDVLIIGGGVAGMMAAVGCRRSGVRPVLMTKGTYPSGSSSMARGGYTAAMGHSNSADKPEFLFEDSVQASYDLCNRRLMRVMSEEAIDRTIELDAWGLGLIRLEDGLYHQKPSASHRYDRLLHCGKLMGKPLMKSLYNKMKEWEYETTAHVMFVDLLKEGDRVTGAWGFFYRDGTPVAIHARSTVMATGGAPQIHEINDSPPYISGDGYAMALRAGADLIDMEFIDYQLMVAAPERLRGYPPHSSGFINAGAYLYNKDKERFMWRYDPERGERATRAIINRAVGTEIYEGRGTENKGVYLDTCHVFDIVNSGATAEIVRVLKNCGVDISKEPFEVVSGPHTYLGGIRIDEWGRTNIDGLYAGGEVAGGIHGANRTGGAALADSYVFGLRAGIGAACEAGSRDKPDPEGDGWREGVDWLEERVNRPGDGSPDEIRKEVQRVCVETIGQIRDGERLKKAIPELDSIERDNGEVSVSGDTFRKRWESMRRILETGNLIQVARMLSTAAMMREESRGGHFRFDFPEIDEENWRCNIVLRAEKRGISARREEVPGEEAGIEPPGAASTAAMPVE
jgi:fumarate reductase (CoM/CoB) subunit A